MKIKNIVSNLIIILTGIITGIFSLDLIIGIPNLKNNYIVSILICLFFIALFYAIWNIYSIIVSKKTKKKAEVIKNKDILTFTPLFILSLFPLRHFISLPPQFMKFSWLPSAILLIFSISFMIFLKILFLDINITSLKVKKRHILIIMAFSFIVFSLLSVIKHQSFYSTAYDLSIYDQAVYGLTKGKNLVSVMGHSIFGDHIQPILLLLTPFYFIYSSPITLVIIQSLAIALGAIPLFLLSKKKLKNDLAALLICIAYFLYPSITFVLLFDFHPIVLSVPFIISAVYFLEQKRYNPLLLSLFLAGLCKEHLPLIFVPFGIYLFFKDKKKTLGIISVLIGILWFYLNFGVLTPLLYKSYEFVPSYFGGSISEAIKTITLNPTYSLKFLLTTSKFAFLTLLIAQVGFGIFSILGLPILLLGITETAILFLHWSNSLSDIVYHHQITSFVFIIVSTVYGISFLNKKLPRLIKRFKLDYINKNNIVIASALFILATSLLANLFYGPFAILYDINDFNIYSDYTKTGHKFLSMIPANAPVAAPNWILPHLSQREKAYTLSHFLRSQAKLFEAGQLEYPEYILMDLSEALIDPKRSALKIKDPDLNKLFNDKNYGIIAEESSWLLLKRGANYEEGICKIKPFLDKTNYPYLNIIIKQNELLEKC